MCHPKGKQIEANITHNWITNEVTILYAVEPLTDYMIESSTNWIDPQDVKISKALNTWEVLKAPTNTGSWTVAVAPNTLVEAYRVYECAE